MEERPLNIYEDDSDDLENEDGELSLNRRRLFLQNGFFREWLKNSSKETSDEENDEDDEKSFFGSGKKFRGFLSKIFEETPEGDKEEPATFDLEDSISESRVETSESEQLGGAEDSRAEISIDHTSEYRDIPPETPVEDSSHISEEIPQVSTENVQIDEDPSIEQPLEDISQEESVYTKYFDSAPTSLPQEVPEAAKKPNTKVEKSPSGVLAALLATEFLGRRRGERRIKKEVKKTNKNIDTIKESLQAARSSSEVAPKIQEQELIKDDKKTTKEKAQKEKTVKITEKRPNSKLSEKAEKEKEIVIEKTTIEFEQKEETPAEVYFDKRHEVMGLEKPKVKTVESKELLKEKQQQAPVSVASVLADKQLNQIEYISAPILMQKTNHKNQETPFEQEILPKKGGYREAVEAGFMIGLVIVGFIAIYIITR